MSNADRNGAGSVSLSTEDQARLFNIAISQRGAILAQDPPIDAETPREAAAATLRSRAVRMTALADVIDATVSGSLTKTPDVQQFLERCEGDTLKWLEDERKLLQMAACGVKVYPGLTAQKAAEEVRTLVADIEADVAALRRII